MCVVPKAPCWMIIDYRVFVVVMSRRANCYEHTVLRLLCNRKKYQFFFRFFSVNFLLLFFS